MKRVYTCFCTDNIHEGHLNILRRAKELGTLTVGVLGDEAMIRYNRFPTLSLEERVRMIRKLGFADEVIVQEDIFYDRVFETVAPDIVVHGDNWLE